MSLEPNKYFYFGIRTDGFLSPLKIHIKILNQYNDNNFSIFFGKNTKPNINNYLFKYDNKTNIIIYSNHKTFKNEFYHCSIWINNVSKWQINYNFKKLNKNIKNKIVESNIDRFIKLKLNFSKEKINSEIKKRNIKDNSFIIKNLIVLKKEKNMPTVPRYLKF